MKPSASEIDFDGWRIALGFNGAAPGGPDFYAAYTGDAFGHPARGILAAIAHGQAETPDKGAGEAAQLVVHSFAEGFFGARRTFGAKRAVHLALHSINTWLFAQIRQDTMRHLVPVSLTAMMFSGGQVGIAHIGACRLYRRRQGLITPLNRPHVREAGLPAVTRGIGLDLEISVDYADELAEPGDSYLLVAGLQGDQPEAVQAAFNLAGGGNRPAVAAMVLDILAAPKPAAVDNAGLADLPLRPAPREGDIWDGFRIGRTIYHGRYTVLKFAHDTIENRDVALKIPLPAMLQDEVFTAGFLREAWIGTTVRGANVARYIELAPERRSSLYLVLPFYDGETLEARLHRGPPVSLPDGVGIALKLCEAVQDLGAIQIVHRDIKPDNVMLLPRNEVRLLDLGLAYLPGIDMQDAVKPGGTMRYMAPELFKGTQANARTEVFALAVTLYRMFAGGAYPFGQREAVPLQRLRPDLPVWLGLILQKALAENPDTRFADAGEFARALSQGLISGAEGLLAGGGRLAWFTTLRLWQIAAGGFALGFLILLIRMLR